jgi:carbon storage regulator
MLILSRAPGEVVCIGDEITITFLGFNGAGEARIGIDAPRTIKVDRQEVYNQRKQEQIKEKPHG